MELLILIIFITYFYFFFSSKREKENKIAINKIYDKEKYTEENSKKINKIVSLIKTDNVTDVKKIAKLSNCSLEECVLRIRYLEEKGLLPNIHLNTIIFKVIKCSDEDEKLLKIYLPTINAKKLHKINFNLHSSKFDDILYLHKKGLIPEIEIDEKNKKITYIDFNKKIKRDLISIRCKSCGALNDVNRGVVTKCKYCNNDIDEIDKE